ncbi:hypothetical protein E3P94_03785 [Wallemia ichthyophaga]|nr:hypothetical protein E3P95_03790 [Wallemia ichthyophaga]TIA96229.1 hypothetical protein E3P94_03785 [Wallemia ichthyophaga]
MREDENKNKTENGDKLSASAYTEELPEDKKQKRLAYGERYSAKEESMRNDYSLAYVNTLIRPQDQIINAYREGRFDEYPRLKHLLALKGELIEKHSYPPTYLPFNLVDAIPSSPHEHSRLFDVINLGSKFDVICIDPPLAGSQSAQVQGSQWTWDALATLPIRQLSADPSFVFVWVGSGGDDGLEKGRELLARWGYRRAEDVIWVETTADEEDANDDEVFEDKTSDTLFKRTKQHCLMGIRGTVRRASDSHFVNCNIDVDTIIAKSSKQKPSELLALIETFCSGTRRLALFGTPHEARRGWLTVGLEGAGSAGDTPYTPPHGVELFDAKEWSERFPNNGTNLVPLTQEIDNLRPKSPTRSQSQNNSRNNTPKTDTRTPPSVTRPPPVDTGRDSPFNAQFNAQMQLQMQMQMQWQAQWQIQWQMQMQMQAQAAHMQILDISSNGHDSKGNKGNKDNDSSVNNRCKKKISRKTGAEQGEDECANDVNRRVKAGVTAGARRVPAKSATTATPTTVRKVAPSTATAAARRGATTTRTSTGTTSASSASSAPRPTPSPATRSANAPHRPTSRLSAAPSPQPASATRRSSVSRSLSHDVPSRPGSAMGRPASAVGGGRPGSAMGKPGAPRSIPASEKIAQLQSHIESLSAELDAERSVNSNANTNTDADADAHARIAELESVIAAGHVGDKGFEAGETADTDSHALHTAQQSLLDTQAKLDHEYAVAEERAQMLETLETRVSEYEKDKQERKDILEIHDSYDNTAATRIQELEEILKARDENADQMDMHNTRVLELEQTVAELRIHAEDVAQLKEKIVALEEVSEVSQEHAQLAANHDAANIRIRELEESAAQHSSLSNEHDSASARIKDLEETIAQQGLLSQQYDAAVSRIKELDDSAAQHSLLSEEHQVATWRIKELEESIAQHGLLSEEYESAITRIKELEESAAQHSSLSEEHEAATSRIKELEESIAQHGLLSEEYESATSRIKELEESAAQHSLLSEEHDTASARIRELEESIAQHGLLSEEYESATSRIKELEKSAAQHSSLSEEYEAATSRIKDLEESIAQHGLLSEEHKAATSRIKELEESATQHHALSEEHKAATTRIKDLEKSAAEHEVLYTQYDSASERIRELEESAAQHALLYAEHEKAAVRIKELEESAAHYDSLSTQQDAANTRIRELEESAAQHEVDMKAYESRMESLQEKASDSGNNTHALQEALDDTSKKLAEALTRASTLEQQTLELQALQEREQHERDEKEEKLIALQSQFNKAETELVNHKHRHEEALKEAHEAHASNENLKEQLHTLNESISNDASSQEVIQKLEEDVASKSGEMEALHSRIKELEGTKEDSSSEIASLKMQLEELPSFMERVTVLEKQVDDASRMGAELAEVKERMRSMHSEQDVAQLRNEIEVLRESTQSSFMQLSAAHSHKEGLEGMLSDSRTKCMKLMGDIESMKAVQKSMTEATTGLNDELNERNYKMQEQNNNLDAALKRMRQAEVEVGELRKVLLHEKDGRAAAEAKLKSMGDETVFNSGNISTEALHKAHNSKIAQIERSYEQMITAMNDESKMLREQIEMGE